MSAANTAVREFRSVAFACTWSGRHIAWYWGRGGVNTTFAAKENAPGDFADQALTQPAAIDGYLLHFRTVLFFLKHFLFCFSSVSQ